MNDDMPYERADVVDLSRMRKARRPNPDADEWTVLDALRYAISKVESGEWKANMVYVALAEDDPMSTGMVFSCAGGSALELKGLLAQHLHYQCDPNGGGANDE